MLMITQGLEHLFQIIFVTCVVHPFIHACIKVLNGRSDLKVSHETEKAGCIIQSH